MRCRPVILAVFLIACGGAQQVDNRPFDLHGGSMVPKVNDPNAVTQMDCGDFHDCARMGDDVEGMIDVAHVAAGSNLSCVRFTSGKVSCWGAGKMLGDGKDVENRKPTEISGLGDVVDLQAGGYVVCALGVGGAGAVTCFGRNEQGELGANPDEDNHGQIGDGSKDPRLTPVKISF